MTDYEKVKSLLDEMKIGYDESEQEFGKQITLEAGKHENVKGYLFFEANFYFDHEEKSTGVGIYE